jgi:hypothetical protein
MSEQPRKPSWFRVHIEPPSCFDEPMTFDLKELQPTTIEALVENLAELNPDDPRLPRLKECWDHLTGD